LKHSGAGQEDGRPLTRQETERLAVDTVNRQVDRVLKDAAPHDDNDPNDPRFDG
jgi:hypothetical protein